jgi:hypothetical protein
LQRWPRAAIVASALGLAFLLGTQPSPFFLVALAALAGAAVLMQLPFVGLLAVIFTSLIGRVAIGTGTDVSLNTSSALVPLLILIWLLIGLRQQKLELHTSRTTLPLVMFLVMSLLTIPISAVTWDLQVPRSGHFVIVQLAQWAIYFFSACVFWLVGLWASDERKLQYMVILLLVLSTPIVIGRNIPGGDSILSGFATSTPTRAPFWLIVSALAGGQLLFNKQLSTRWKVYLAIVLGGAVYYALITGQERSSNWVGVGAALGTMIWLRLPRLRWLAGVAVLGLALSGVLFDLVYEFAGGDDKWVESGASRGALIERVIEVSMRNPVTGIGLGAYRPYGLTRPLYYEGAYWLEPRINSHNNYVDLFSQTGIVGLGILLWFMAELGWLAWRLRKVYKTGFASGYVNGMLGAWVGTMLIMALADWFLPFVYNVGFHGFQASVLLWLFFGGLLALERMAQRTAAEATTSR